MKEKIRAVAGMRSCNMPLFFEIRRYNHED
jgi:hypothetical protein